MRTIVDEDGYHVLVKDKINMESKHDQPLPTANDKPAVWDLVMEDMRERDQIGCARYGSRLQGHNGRDALKDAYQEALHLAVYLRQAIFERDGK